MSNLLGSTIFYILVECSLFTSFHLANSPVYLNMGIYVQQELYSQQSFWKQRKCMWLRFAPKLDVDNTT